MRLQEEGVKAPGLRAAHGLAAALKKNAKAHAAFGAFAPNRKCEYIEWLTEAKREDTRARCLAQTVEWMAEGKQRHWKCQNG